MVILQPETDLLQVFRHWMRLAASRLACTAGKSSAIKTPMMAITTSSSINVKPQRRLPNPADPSSRCPPSGREWYAHTIARPGAD